MKSAQFTLHQPNNLEQSLKVLHQYQDDVKVISGGQTLLPILAMRVASPLHLLDINLLEELNHISITKNELKVGAIVRHSDLEEYLSIEKTLPLLKEMIPWIAHLAIRHRGTVCGSIAHADPSAELPLALLILDGSVELRSKSGTRRVLAKNFFLGALQTDRQADELITAVFFPVMDRNEKFGFAEFGYRHGDFAVVSVAIRNIGTKWKIGFGGIHDTPKVFEESFQTREQVIAYINDLASSEDVREDSSTSAGFRRHLMRSLGHQVIHQILGRT